RPALHDPLERGHVGRVEVCLPRTPPLRVPGARPRRRSRVPPAEPVLGSQRFSRWRASLRWAGPRMLRDDESCSRNRHGGRPGRTEGSRAIRRHATALCRGPLIARAGHASLAPHMPALRRPLVLLVCVVGGAAVAAQNSTRKIRPEPSAAAGRAGKAVQWRADLAAALDEARREGKPVFWYVPTVPGSPMDRKAEIDRYMMAGPFSWPDTVRWLNERFVPVKAVPAPEEARERGLVRGKFIEPGFVVLDAEGGERLRCDRVATHAPDWWRARLSHALAEELPDARPAAMVEALAAYGRDDFGAALAALDELARGEGDVAAQATFLRGVVAARQGDHAACERAWDELRARFPEHMLASKVAAEREGFGPFRRGFEDFRPLPEAVLAGATASTQAPPGAYGKAEAIARSLRFLVEQQEGDGLYRDSTYDFGGTD